MTLILDLLDDTHARTHTTGRASSSEPFAGVSCSPTRHGKEMCLSIVSGLALTLAFQVFADAPM